MDNIIEQIQVIIDRMENQQTATQDDLLELADLFSQISDIYMTAGAIEYSLLFQEASDMYLRGAEGDIIHSKDGSVYVPLRDSIFLQDVVPQRFISLDDIDEDHKGE